MKLKEVLAEEFARKIKDPKYRALLSKHYGKTGSWQGAIGNMTDMSPEQWSLIMHDMSGYGEFTPEDIASLDAFVKQKMQLNPDPRRRESLEDMFKSNGMYALKESNVDFLRKVL